jgi:hypothetical protein
VQRTGISFTGFYISVPCTSLFRGGSSLLQIFWVLCTFLMAGGVIAWGTPFLHTGPDGRALLRLLRFVRMPYGQRGIGCSVCKCFYLNLYEVLYTITELSFLTIPEPLRGSFY